MDAGARAAGDDADRAPLLDDEDEREVPVAAREENVACGRLTV